MTMFCSNQIQHELNYSVFFSNILLNGSAYNSLVVVMKSWSVLQLFIVTVLKYRVQHFAIKLFIFDEIVFFFLTNLLLDHKGMVQKGKFSHHSVTLMSFQISMTAEHKRRYIGLYILPI